MTTRSRLELLICRSWALLLRHAAVPAAQAQNYPNRPITMIVPFAAGRLDRRAGPRGGDDAAEKIGQNIVVENKTGATGTIGVGLRCARHAGRLHAVRQFARRRAEPALSCR